MFEVSQIFSLNSISELSPAALFFVFFFATFISEDAACLSAGAMAGNGKISFALALSACFTGIFVGDVLLYFSGRIFGNRILKTKIFSRFVSEKAIEKASAWIEKRGAVAVFLSRFITGLRLPTYLAAGFLRTDFLKFSFYFLLASAIWTPILIGSAAFSNKLFFSQNLIFSFVFTFIAVRILIHFASWKNRRLFIGRLKRILNWEFWSIKIFYFPVVIYVLFLGVKHRCLTIFTCANPAIIASGFVGESKCEIYQSLIKSCAAEEFLLKFIFLSNEISFPKKIVQAHKFIKENKLNFPLVLKPDAGERGKGVKFVRNFSQLINELEQIEQDYILQEFADGVEISVFYYRYPGENEGKIFSITEKCFPKLTGDGNATLETLILRDERAVCLARSYFEENREKLNFVPKKGEEIQIIDIGTHSRGAIFHDGGWLKTERLKNKIDEICRGFTGFYFGRFDIRADSFADLKRGENFKIIELNGVTSESTNIYDKNFSLFDAYRILFEQWHIACSIGKENHKLGVKPVSLIDLAKLILGLKISNKTIACEAVTEKCA
ncbi:MAG TPA: VTT domain-containing protein [Pyrinomonadaceae bacterium]|jgi:membrane protein DedA with SNARE-associated domain